MISDYKTLFVKDGKPLQGFKAKIVMKEHINPIVCKAHQASYALKDKVTEELKRPEADGVIEHVEHSDWAASMVVVPKSDNGSIRLCRDYKVTVNREINEEQYQLPNIDDTFTTLAGGKQFTKLDLSQAYAHFKWKRNRNLI